MREVPSRVHEWHAALLWSWSRAMISHSNRSVVVTRKMLVSESQTFLSWVLWYEVYAGATGWRTAMRSWHSQMLSFQASDRPLKQIHRGRRLLFREEISIMHPLGFARMCCKFYASFPPILNMLWNDLLWCAHQRTLAWGLSKLVNWL